MNSDVEGLEMRFGGEGAWQREARRLCLLAAELNIDLDDEALLLCDVRDLQTLRLRLRDALGTVARHHWRPRQAPLVDLSLMTGISVPTSGPAALVARLTRRATR